MSIYTFVVSILNDETQETHVVIAKGQSELVLLISRLPDHYALLSVQNLGLTEEAHDFVSNLTDEGHLNFGNDS